MRKILFILSVSLFFGCQKECGTPGAISYQGHRMSLIGSKAPQNSIQSLNEVISSGHDLIELDVRSTLDGELVVIHEDDFCHSTGVRGKVSGWLSKEMPRLKNNETIPKLSEVKEIIRNSSIKEVTVDIKNIHDLSFESFFEEVRDMKLNHKIQIVMEPYEFNLKKIKFYCSRFKEIGLDVEKYWYKGSYCK